MNSSPVHSLYSETGFSITELKAYQNEGDLLDRIKKQVINYNDNDLKANQYQLYQRSYS